jgi:phosphate acyltransferase
MRIVIDAMGSDTHPAPEVEGAVWAKREHPEIDIIMVGDKERITRELEKHGRSCPDCEIVHAEDFVTMDDKPSKVLRNKPDASMAMAMRMVKEGRADAAVTVGNTGAALAYALLKEFKRMPHVMRPAFPSVTSVGDRQFVMLDSGANSDCRPEWLFQFAVMGSAYAESVLGATNPAVGLLSNGEEEGKGNNLVRTTENLLAQSDLNFIGNVEPRDILRIDVQVVVTDGFTGNLALKTFEATGKLIVDMLNSELKADWRAKIGALLAYPALRRVRKRLDPFEIGAAPLLGVNGLLLVGHGRSNGKAIKSAINQARISASKDLLSVIRERMSSVETPKEQ